MPPRQRGPKMMQCPRDTRVRQRGLERFFYSLKDPFCGSFLCDFNKNFIALAF